MRPIDADALIDEINKRIDAAIKWGVNAIADHDDEIKVRAEQAVATFCEASLTAKKMPTIDAVEVVRCRDCKYMTEHYDTDGNVPYWTCSEWDCGTDYDGFCHYAEREGE